MNSEIFGQEFNRSVKGEKYLYTTRLEYFLFLINKFKF